MKKKIFALLAAFLACTTLGVLSACKDKGSDSSSSGGGSFDSGLTGDEMMCSVTVKSEGGMKVGGVTVCAVDASGNVVKEAQTGANGKANLYLDEGEYTVQLKDIPLGYYITSFGEKLSTQDPDANITLGIELVDEEDRAGHIYKVGDVMHDFSIPTFSGETLTLSELLEEKDMVFLNFWYLTCNPCLTEMPWMNNTYNDDRYAGQFELIAVHGNQHSAQEAKEELKSKNWNFQFSHNELTNIASYFPIEGFPTTVIIDRYGVVTVCESGRLENQIECDSLVAKHLGANYTQDFSNVPGGGTGEDYDNTLPEVTVADPSNEELNTALGTNGLEYSLDDNPYVWPFIVTEVDGRDCIYAPNSAVLNTELGVEAHYTSSVLNVKVNVPETDYSNYVFTFDYKISSEFEADYFYVLVDGVIIQKYSGPDMVPDEFGNLYVPAEWKTSYAYVPVKGGEHTLSFAYQKDSGVSDGDDTVYIDNLRFEPMGEGQSYVFRNAATERNNENDGFKTDGDSKDAPRFDKYASVYYNEIDGLYHVHNENGPLLLANLMDTRTEWSQYPIWNYLAVGNYLEYTDGGEVMNLFNIVETFANAELHSDNGYIPVNAELQALLQFITEKFGSGYENEWLEICCYYDAYNCDQMPNPCAGVNFQYAIQVSANGIKKVGDQTRVTVNIQKLLNPRGYKYAFTPTVSGVYSFASDRTTISTDPSGLDPIVWFTDDLNNYDSDGALRFLYASEVGVDFNFMYRLVAGKTYYLAAADHDPNKIGDKYEIVISLVSTGTNPVQQFTECAIQPYVNILDGNGQPTWQAEAKGVKWEVDNNGYVRVVRADKTLASYVYLNMLDATYFMNTPMKDVIEGKTADFGNSAFDFSNLMIDTDGDGVTDTAVTDENGKPYGNYLSKMKTYLSQATANTGELKGFVKVTEELQLILELFSKKVHGEDIRESWQTMCYYYKEI